MSWKALFYILFSNPLLFDNPLPCEVAEFEILVLLATLAKFFSLEVADLLFRTEPARISEFVGIDRVGVEPALRFRSTATGTIHLRFDCSWKLPLEGASECVDECVEVVVLGRGKWDGRMTAWTDMIFLHLDLRLFFCVARHEKWMRECVCLTFFWVYLNFCGPFLKQNT